MRDWYRERPFKVAFVVSVVIHAALIAVMPGFRSVPIETPRVLEVEIVPMQAPPEPRVEERPVVLPKMVAPRVEPVPEPVVRLPPQPEPPPVPRTEVIPVPRAEPRPEFVVPRPELRPEPKAELPLESSPEPKIELPPEPAARVEPRPEPQPLPREAPPPVVQPRVEPSVAAPTPPVVVPQLKAVDESRERTLIERYQQIISAKIKQHEEYPPVAKRRHWEGTTVVQLRLTPEGKVTDIAIVERSGHEILDEAAVKMIRKASPLPLPPEGLRGSDHTVFVPIKFRLAS